MRITPRLFAAVKSGRFLEAGAPTGLTGLRTHQSPRPRLIYLYRSTLDRLKEFPENSVYRQSTEALTRHRLEIVEQVEPAGYDEWTKRAAKKIEDNPRSFAPGNDKYSLSQHGNDLFVRKPRKKNIDIDRTEYDGEKRLPIIEGPRSESAGRLRAMQAPTRAPEPEDTMEWEDEPQLEVSQIAEIEDKIGAGLIEEVIQVAEGELRLVDTMKESQVWEELEEKPHPGQWEYFQRNQHEPIS